MAEKSIKARIVSRHDSEANWNKATGFIPKSGEVIIYSPDSTYAYSRIKVGDGITAAANLPFANNEYIIIDVSEQLNTASGSSQLSGTLTSGQLAVIKANMSKTALDVGGVLVNFINGTYDPSSNSGDVMYATNYLSGITTDSEGVLVDPQGVTYVVSVNLGTGAIKASGGQLGFGVHMIPLESTIDSTNTSGTLPEADLKVINAGYQNCLISLGGTIYRPFRLRDGNASYQMVYLGGKIYIVNVVEINLTTGAYTIQSETNPLDGVNLITISDSGSGTLATGDLQKIKSSPQNCMLIAGEATTVLTLGSLTATKAQYFTTKALGKQYITIDVTINLETGAYTIQSEWKSIVTTEDTQTITGDKTFSGSLNIPSGTVVGSTSDNPSLVLGNNAAYYYKNKIVYKDSSDSTQTLTFPAKSGTLAITSDIPDTSDFAKTADLTSGAITPARALEADTAGQAHQDASGNVITTTYAKTSDLTEGTITVRSADVSNYAESAANASIATIASKDGDGNVITTTYATKAELTDGSVTKVGNALTVGSITYDGSIAVNAGQRTWYGTCSTDASTAGKEVTCAGFTLESGAKITVKFTVTNTASSPTLNVNSTGAKSIYYHGSSIPYTYLLANRIYQFVYTGERYELVGDLDTNTTYQTSTNARSGLIRPWYYHNTSATGPTSTQDTRSITVNAASNVEGRYYPIEMDVNGRAFVNVPWEAGSSTSTANVRNDVY